VHLDLVRQHLAAAVDVREDALLQVRHLVPQQVRRGGQVRVVVLQGLDLVLQPRDALQFAHPALGGCDAVPEPLPLGLHVVVGVGVDVDVDVDVDGGHRGALPEALHVRHRLRLLLQRLDPTRLRDRVRGVVHGVVQRPAAVTVQVGVHREVVRLHRHRALQAGAQLQAAAALRRRAAAQLVLLVQILQRLHEALRELLLVRARLRVEELGQRRRGGDHPVGLDDQPLQLRGGQLQEPQVRGAEQKAVGGGVAEMRLEVRVVRQAHVDVLLHHYESNRKSNSRAAPCPSPRGGAVEETPGRQTLLTGLLLRQELRELHAARAASSFSRLARSVMSQQRARTGQTLGLPDFNLTNNPKREEETQLYRHTALWVIHDMLLAIFITMRWLLHYVHSYLSVRVFICLQM